MARDEVQLTPSEVTAVEELDWVSNNTDLIKDNSGSISWLLHNRTATTDPTTWDDSWDWYAVWSRWINITDDKEFVCLDATLTAAVWTETTWWAWDVAWPWSSTDNAVARFDSTTGKFIQNSNAILDDTWNITYEWSVSIKEKASANADVAAYGQIWVKSDTPNTLYFTDDAWNDRKISPTTESIQLACSDLTTDLTTGTSKAYFRIPYAFTLTEVRASVLTAPTWSTIIVDINESGTTILSTKLSIDAGEKTSTTATSAAVISDSSLADDSEITIDLDQVWSTVAWAWLIVTLIGNRT